MPYRINVYLSKDGKLSEDKDSKHVLYIDQAEKAIITFEMDMFVCYLYRRFTDAVFGDRAPGIREELRNDGPIPEDDRKVIDGIYEDILAIVEFYQNRITSQGDPAIERMMVHMRFSAAYLLRVDQTRAEMHKHPRSNKKLNTAMFRHDQRDDLREISHLDYNGLDLRKLVVGDEMDCKKIMDILEIVHHDAVRDYYDRILSAMEGGGHFHVRLKDTDGDSIAVWRSLFGGISEFRSNLYIPLFPMISVLSERLPECLRWIVDIDYKDLRNGNIRMMAPAMGKIKNRDEDLESSLHTPQDVAAGYDEATVKDCIFFIRMLDCIFGNSFNERGKVELALSFEGMIRMLDPKLFGWNYDIPPVVFCTQTREPFDMFRKGLSRITENNVIIMESVKVAQSEWTSGKRMKAGNRVTGGLCQIPEPVYVGLSDMPEFLRRTKESTIIVTDSGNLDDIVSHLSSFTKVSDKNKVKFVAVMEESIKMIFINSLIPYTTVTVVNRKNIFDMLTLYNLKIMRAVADSYLNRMSSEIGVERKDLRSIGAEDIRTVFYRTFAKYAEDLIANVDDIESYFR